MPEIDNTAIDCAAGRALGCQSFCCRLLVRLEPDEMIQPTDGSVAKGYVDKDETGYCIHFNQKTYRCGIWKTRPKICRAYECNSDFLLQIALREKFSNIVELSKMAAAAYIPIETYRKIPLLKSATKK